MVLTIQILGRNAQPTLGNSIWPYVFLGEVYSRKTLTETMNEHRLGRQKPHLSQDISPKDTPHGYRMQHSRICLKIGSLDLMTLPMYPFNDRLQSLDEGRRDALLPALVTQE